MKKLFAAAAAVSAFASGAFAQEISEEMITASTQSAGMGTETAILLAILFIAVLLSNGSGGSIEPERFLDSM